jgi:3-methyladenine DNA glycosylase AlkD
VRTTGGRPTDPGHRQLLDALHDLAGHGPITPERPDRANSNTTSGRPYYGVSVPDERALVKRWLSAQHGAPTEQVRRTVLSLLAGVSYEEKALGCIVLQGRPDVRASVGPTQVVAWLDDLSGWAEVDSLCQSVFGADELLADWGSWRSAIVELSNSPNPNKRRASLVLLTKAVGHSEDPRLRGAALEVLDRALADRDPLVTKAVSWLLRALTRHHRQVVADYLDRHGADLAPVALRETRTKLKTGTKSGR